MVPHSETFEVNFGYTLEDGRVCDVHAGVHCDYNRYAYNEDFPFEVKDIDLSIVFYKDKTDYSGEQLFKANITESDYTKLLNKCEEQAQSQYWLNKDEDPLVDNDQENSRMDELEVLH